MADRALSRYRAAVAVEYRLKGMSYEAIAAELGYGSRASAWKAVDRCLGRREAAAAKEFFTVAFLDLNFVQSRIWSRAMTGDVSAASACIRAIDVRLRLVERYHDLRKAS